jgi:phage/plasmid primase-like uncharacterized protein
MSANNIKFEGNLIADGERHRFSIDHKKNEPDEFYSYQTWEFKDRLYAKCWYGTWSGGLKQFWFKSWEHNHDASLTKEDWIIFKNEEQERDKIFKEQQEKTKQEKLEWIKKVWEEAALTPSSKAHTAYLERKKIDPIGVKFGKDSYGKSVLIIPIKINGGLKGLEFIYENGEKRTHGTKTGGSHTLGQIKNGEDIIVAEGYSTGASCYKAKNIATVITFGVGNLDPVIDGLVKTYPASKNRITIIADDDRDKINKATGKPENPGKEAAEAACKKYGCKYILPQFPDEFILPGSMSDEYPNGKRPKDVNELHVHFGIDAVKEQLKEENYQEIRNDNTNENSFRFLSLDSLLQVSPKPNWIIKDYLDVGSLSVLFGEPGSMKSFVAIDIGLSVATGLDWHESSVQKQGPVFYIAGEGFSGISRRLRAWTIVNKINSVDTPFFVSDRAAQLSDEINATEVVHAIEGLTETCGKPILVIVDTLNRNFGPGDENSTVDMTTFISMIDHHIRSRYGCAVMIVHHSPLNDKNRARGASSLHAALDWEYRLKKNDNIRELSCTKVKDYEAPHIISFEPVTVELEDWTDTEEGEPMTSCVLIKTNRVNDSSKSDKLTSSEKVALDCLVELYQSKVRISEDEWRIAVYKKMLDKTQDTKKKAFKRAKEGLIKKERIEITENNEYRPIGTRDRDGT